MKPPPISGTVVDPQLRHTFTHRLNVARIAGGEALNPGFDTRSRLDVAQAVKPLDKYVGLTYFNHEPTVAIRLHNVNGAAKTLNVPNVQAQGRAACGASLGATG